MMEEKENKKEQSQEDMSDYNDFLKEEELQSQEPDSFNKDIMEKYEDHKKSEVKPTNRPISSYQRIPSPMGSVGNQESKSIHEPRASYEELIQLLNSFIMKNCITRSKFCDNPTVFFLLCDFKELFMALHFPISSNDISTLFDSKNINAKDGYINLSDFMRQLSFYKGKGICQNLSSNTISHQDSESSKSFGILEMKNLNEEYFKFNKDINSILKEDRKMMTMNNNNNALLGASSLSISTSSGQRRRVQTAKQNQNQNQNQRKLSIDSTNRNLNSSQNRNQTVDSLPNINKKDNHQSGNGNVNSNKKKLPPKPKYDSDKIIEEMKKENEKEEQQIRSDFEKRTRAFIKDCIYKCAEANKMCKELKIEREFQIVDDNGIKVQILENNERERYIELKAFVVEWRMIQKAYLQKQNEKIYAVKESSKKDKVNQVQAKKNEKKEKLDEVKKVLIDTVRLKMKLKNQLESLQKTIKVDESIVIEHLVKAGIDIPGYYSNNPLD